MVSEISFKRILFATDFLESSRLALDYAVAFAAHFKATLVMLHVVELSSAAEAAESETLSPCVTRAAGEERLEAMAKGVRRLGLEIETHVEDGIPSEVILSAVGQFHADLLVLGIHGVHRGLEHLLVGSNAEKILMCASCPVLTLGAHVLSGIDLELHLKEIMYFSDFTREAIAAAPYALFLEREFHAPVDVCRLLPEDTKRKDGKNDEQQSRDHAESYCESMQIEIGEGHPEWCTPAFQLEHGMEADQMVERAQSRHAGLIVLGVRTATQLGRHLHTSLAYQLLAKATCPVLSVRHAEATPAKVHG